MPSPRSLAKASIKKWFVVYGDTAQQTLQRLEAFMPALAKAQTDGMFGGIAPFRSIHWPASSRIWPC